MPIDKNTPQPFRLSDGKGWIDHGPRNIMRDRENPDILVPPPTDHGTIPNLRFSFSDAHMRLEEGGWTREITNRELPASLDIAGVNMSLEPGAYRELHWHKEAEWGYMLYGNARVTAIDEDGRIFIDDVKEGDIWNFEAGIPHSIQGLDQGCEFLLVFSEADFSENNTFLLTELISHIPQDVIAANFKMDVDTLKKLPQVEKYIFKGEVPGPINVVRKHNEHGDVPSPFTFHRDSITPHECEAGKVYFVDERNFPEAKTISAAFVEIEPGGMREIHWHPRAQEWLYFIEGKARMTVFNSQGTARTFNYQAGDVGVVPIVAGHYIQNIGDEPVRFIEVFKRPDAYPISRYSDISLNAWLASTPTQIVADHLNLTFEEAEALPNPGRPEPVIWYKKPEGK